MNRDNPLHDDDPENDGFEEHTHCVLCSKSSQLALCQVCFDTEHGPDNDKDSDPECTGGYTYDIQAIEETQC